MRWITLAAIAAIGAFVVPATAQQQRQQQGQAAAEVERGTVLNVTASGVSLAPPDMATVSLGVTTQTLQNAYPLSSPRRPTKERRKRSI